MDEGKNKRLVVKFVCVFLSFCLWLYISNVENPIRTSEIRGVPVEITNEDVLSKSNMCISSNQVFTVDLKLEGPANDIYRVKKQDFVIKLDLSSYALKVGENNIPVQVEKAPEGITIKNSSVLAVKINVENKIDKQVSLYSKVITNYKNGFVKNTSSIEPSEVTISGAESCVNKVSKVALIGEVNNISSDVNDKFKLEPVDSDGNVVNGITISEKEATLHINVAIQKEVSINPTFTGALSGQNSLEAVNLSKSKVLVKGKSKDITNLSTINTYPIDLSSITSDTDVKVSLRLPEGVTLVNKESITASIKIKGDKDSQANQDMTTSSDNVTKTIKDINVNLINVPENNHTYTADKISIEVSGLKQDVDNITAENVVATASVGDITETGEIEVQVSISLPNTYSNVSILSKPEKVKVNVK